MTWLPDAQTWMVGVLMVLAFCGIAGWMLAGTVVDQVSSRGRHRSDGRPQLMLTSIRVERVIPAADWLRPEDDDPPTVALPVRLVESWGPRECSPSAGLIARCHAETPIFADLARVLRLESMLVAA